MNEHLRRLELPIIFLVIFGGALLLYSQRVAIKERFFTSKPDVPAAESRAEAVATPPTTVTNTSASSKAPLASLPSEKNLRVPFTSQAPLANWDAEHEEFCEEASVLMLGRYWLDRPIDGPDDAEQALQQLKQWELDTFGYFKDTTAVETARILREFYEFRDVAVLSDPTLADLQREIAAGHPVIVPAAGRQLGNPNFKPPGPLYHMLVLKGYTADGRLITNDPGTRKGADYVYAAGVVLAAMHDWNGGDVDHGAKVAIVVRGR